MGPVGLCPQAHSTKHAVTALCQGQVPDGKHSSGGKRTVNQRDERFIPETL